MDSKVEVFEKELSAISNLSIRKFAEKIISNIPEYFFEVPASSTGKYHPRYALGSGGLVRHTKAAVNIAIDLLKLEHNSKFTQDEKECIIVALICHDGWKHGDNYSQYTVAEHPVVAANHVLEFADGDEKEFAKTISDNIRSHMGEWNTDFKNSKEIMPKPHTESEIFVHLCDYLASRKYLSYEFDKWYEPKSFLDKTIKQEIDNLIVICKDKITQGIDRDLLYNIISEKNNGNKNPNSIKSLDTVRELIDEISNLKGED